MATLSIPPNCGEKPINSLIIDFKKPKKKVKVKSWKNGQIKRKKIIGGYLQKKHLKLFSQNTYPKLVRQLDKAIGDYLKAKRNYLCIYCGKKCIPNSRNTTISHYWDKKIYGSVRFTEENMDVAHFMPCHSQKLEPDKQGWYKEYKIYQLGQKGFNMLEIKAKTVTKFTRSDILMLINYYKGHDNHKRRGMGVAESV